MRLASLDMWPDKPFLSNTYKLQIGPAVVTEGYPQANCVVRFLLGLMHEDEHLDQIATIVRQAKADRGG
jgi:hypothetical protein